MFGEVITSPLFKIKYLTSMSQLLNSSHFVQKLLNSVARSMFMSLMFTLQSPGVYTN